jgi:hypothetical protein
MAATFDLEASLRSLRDEGFVSIPGVYSKDQCRDFVSRCNRVSEKLESHGKIDSQLGARNIWNFFRHDPELMPLVHNEPMDKIFRGMLDDDYVLIAANVINRQAPKGATGPVGGYADNWHTDSRYLGGQRLACGFNFGMLIMLEPFSAANGATQYVPRTHLDRSIPERQGNYEHKTIEGDAGTMIILDSGLWHRGGVSSQISRWGVFSMYGPWFMKPYFRFPEMIGEAWAAKLTPELRQLFHFDSTPPLDEDERIMTLAKNYRKGAS